MALGFGAFVVLADLSLLPRAAGSSAPVVAEGILLFFAAIGAGMVVMGIRGALSHAVADGVVAHITGLATLQASYGRSTSFDLYIGDVRHSPIFDITGGLYHAITKGEILTAYCLPHADKLVNLEPGPTSAD